MTQTQRDNAPGDPFLFGDRVREARRMLDWSQAQLASRVNVTRGYVSLLERGLRTPSESVAGRIFRAIVGSRLPPNSVVQGTFWEIDEEGHIVFGMRLSGKEHPVAWRGWKVEPDDPTAWGAAQLESYLNLYSVIISAFLEHLEVYPAERLEPLAERRPSVGTFMAFELDKHMVEHIARRAAEEGTTIQAEIRAALEWHLKLESTPLGRWLWMILRRL